MEQSAQKYGLEDITYVNTRCKECGENGSSPTLKHILENKEAPLTQMVEKQGYVSILCPACTKH